VSTELVRLAVVENELAAEAIRGLLKTEGIDSMQRMTDFGVGMTDAGTSGFGPREILVRAEDLEAARELIEDADG
jgi:hypothetical protein